MTQPLPHITPDRLPDLFAEAYGRIFSLSYLDEAIEVVNWKVEVAGPEPE